MGHHFFNKTWNETWKHVLDWRWKLIALQASWWTEMLPRLRRASGAALLCSLDGHPTNFDTNKYKNQKTSRKNKNTKKTKKTKVPELMGPRPVQACPGLPRPARLFGAQGALQDWRPAGFCINNCKNQKSWRKTKKRKKQNKQRFKNLLGPCLGPPLRAVVFFGFFGTELTRLPGRGGNCEIGG